MAQFCEIQAIYMPLMPQLLVFPLFSSAVNDVAATLSENVCLLLLSDVLKTEREDGPRSNLENGADRAVRTAQCDAILRGLSSDLVDAERRLCEAQCYTALEDLWIRLNMRTRLRAYKRINVRHQGPNIRVNEALSNVERRIQHAADKYRVAQDALKSIIGVHSTWTAEHATVYPKLKDADIRTLDADDSETVQCKKKMKKGKRVAEGSRHILWIWHGVNTDDGLNAGTPLLYILLLCYILTANS